MSGGIQNCELWDGRHAWCWGYVDGLPAFRWGWAPTGLATRRQLQQRRLRRSRGQDPYGVLVWNSRRFGSRTADLYRVDQAIPSREMTPRWRASLAMAYLAHCTCRGCGQEFNSYLPTSIWRCSETCG